MEDTRPVWRLLRPVVLAAAAATSWIALSASAATADASADPNSLLTSIGSSVEALTPASADPDGHQLLPSTERAPEVSRVTSLDPAPSAARQTLLPTVHVVTTAADDILQSVPIVPAFIPAESATTLTDPVLQLADAAIDTASETALPPISAAIAVLDSGLDPVIDAGIVPPASPAPGTGTRLPQIIADGGAGREVSSQAEPSVSRKDSGASTTSLPTTATPGWARAAILSPPASGAAVTPAPCLLVESRITDAAAAVPAYPAEYPLHALPERLLAAPGSGSAGNSTSGAGPSPVAWLSDHHFEVPALAGFPVQAALLQAPSPVSFDPGSSPD